MPIDLDNELPPHCTETWNIFARLHARRGSNGFSPNRITDEQLLAYQIMHRSRLLGWQLEAISLADDAYFKWYAEYEKTRKGK